MAIEFMTTQDLKNRAGEITGSIRIAKMKDEPLALVKYKCPDCGHEETKRKRWEEPFLIGTKTKKMMNVVCASCEKKMTILRLQKQIAKEKKVAKARKKREEKKVMGK